MESQLQHTQGHHNDEQEILTGHHDHNIEDGEKKSMMQKVKNKAKRFRNTITKHGHGPQQHDDDGDDNEDETIEDPKVHGAPNEKLTPPSGNLERPSVIAEDHHTKPVASHGPPPTVPAGADGTNLSGQSGLGGQEVNPEEKDEVPETEYTNGTKHASDPFENRGQDGTHGGSKNNIGKSTGMLMVPDSPSGLGSGSDPTNYQTKVTNPTGGKEAGLSQMQHSFDKMGIQDSGSERKRFDPEDPESIRRATLAGNQSTQSSSYKEKISSTASAIAEKAVVTKDVIASKLGYSGEHPTTAESHENAKNAGSVAADYAHKITDKVTETLAPVYEKVVDAGKSVMSKVHGTETVKGTDKGVSVKEGDESAKKSGEEKPMGRVTESLEVRRRLGTDSLEEQQQQQSGNVTERSE